MPEPYCRSYYAATANPIAPFPSLQGEIETDVAIIGGGFTGIATALELAERGTRVAVLEANHIGWGASGRNGGQVTGSLSGDRAMARQFRRTLGEDATEFVWNLRWRGQRIIEARVQRYGIRCDLKHGHMQAAYQPSHVAELEDLHRTAVARGMGEDVLLVRGAELCAHVGTTLYHAGLINRRNLHLHPLNLCLGEADAARGRGARIFTETRVRRIAHGRRPELITDGGRVRADQVLIAGNGQHGLARRRLAGMLFPATLGIVATEPLSEDLARSVLPTDLAVYDTRFVLDYYRLTADRRLLFGSGTNYKGTASRDIGAPMRPAIRRTFPQLGDTRIEFAWEGQDGITINRIPQLGRVAPNVFYAQGYSGHGIAFSHIIGEIMAAAMTGDGREFDVFAAARHWRLPVGRYLGNRAMASGMWLFQMLEARR